MEAKEYTGWRHGTSKQHALQDRIQKKIPKRRKKSQNNSPSFVNLPQLDGFHDTVENNCTKHMFAQTPDNA